MTTMNQTNQEGIPEKDCTPKCHSHIHAQQILSCVTKATTSEIRAYCLWLCYNFSTVTDELGRNLLHLASSCGKWEVVEWLLEQCHCEVDIRDAESGWTALHRSLFYGHLTTTRILLFNGANLRMTDHDGFTPLDIAVKDRLPYIEYIPTNPLEVYVWGSNANYNLGLGNEQSRTNPEILDMFRRDSISIKQVVICKFHSVFLSNDGRLFTCGHGHGGRLGQGSEETGLVPASVRGLGPTRCELVASGQDHLVLLMDGGQVWSCGLNTYHQLGHCPPPERLVTPKPLSLKFLKGNEVVGICASRFHSVIYTKDAVYTFGLNAGQLGHPKGDRTQILPRQVSAVYNKEWEISHVAASDGATVCATNRGDVYVLHEYQHRKIASRQLEIRKLSVIGGHLDSRCDVAGVREGGGLELRVILLTKSGKVFLWRQSNPFLRRCLFTSGQQLLVSDIYLNHYTVAMVTYDNEGFLGHILPFKEKKNANCGSLSSSPPSSKIQNSYGQLNALLDREDCDLIRAKRIPHIHRATGITCDSKGRNFAVLQSSPKMGLIDLPMVSTSEMQQHMLTLMEEAHEHDIIHDIVVKVGQKEYFSHKYILASRSDYFRKQIMSGSYSTGRKIIVENVQPEAFEQVLKFMYCNTCDFLVDGYEVKSKTTEGTESFDSSDTNLKGEIFQTDFHKISAYKILQEKKQNKHGTGTKLKDKGKKNIYYDPLKAVQEASKRLNVPGLNKRLEEVRLINGKVKLNCTSYFPKFLFDRNKLQDLCDVTLCAKDGTEFPCHRCILAARLEYFHSMLGSCWIETSSAESLPLPVSSKILNIVLGYLYTDDAPEVFASEDPEFLCHILVVADQLLISRLKEICEMAIVDLITLKNASELLEFSYLYNAVQLKKTCMQYICINLPAILEARCLDVLSNEAIEELSSFYRNMVPSMSRRFITPNPDIPTTEELEAIEKNFPVSKDCDIVKYRADSVSTKSHENRGKGRRRTHSQRGEFKETLLSCVQRSDSVSSEMDINLDIDLSLKEDELDKVQNEISINLEEEKNTLNNSDISMSNKVLTPEKVPGKWHISQKLYDAPRLDEIMMEEKKWEKSPKSPSFHSESKRVTHLSQKQKKMLAVSQTAVIKDHTNKIVSSVPPISNQLNKNAPCPWAKKSPPLLQSQSFWDVVASKDSKPSFETSPSSNNMQSWPTSPSLSDDSKTSCTVNPWLKDQSVIQEDQQLVVSLEAIQRAEEEKLHNAVKPYIKPLHLINLEDQAIEELLVLYKAVDNPNEKISVNRVLPEKIATPVWKKHV